MRRSTQGGKNTLPLHDYAQQENTDRTGPEEEIQQVSRETYTAQGNQGIELRPYSILQAVDGFIFHPWDWFPT